MAVVKFVRGCEGTNGRVIQQQGEMGVEKWLV